LGSDSELELEELESDSKELSELSDSLSSAGELGPRVGRGPLVVRRPLVVRCLDGRLGLCVLAPPVPLLDALVEDSSDVEFPEDSVVLTTAVAL